MTMARGCCHFIVPFLFMTVLTRLEGSPSVEGRIVKAGIGNKVELIDLCPVEGSWLLEPGLHKIEWTGPHLGQAESTVGLAGVPDPLSEHGPQVADRLKPVSLGVCDEGAWEDLVPNDGFTGSAESCRSGVTFLEASTPGRFNFSCELYISDRLEGRHEFTVLVQDDSPRPTLPICEAHYLPQKMSSNARFTIELICRLPYSLTTDVDGNHSAESSLLLRRNNETLKPDINTMHELVSRQTLDSEDDIFNFSCTFMITNETALCNFGKANIGTVAIGIEPIVSKVRPGSDVTFNCLVDEGWVDYEWSLPDSESIPGVSGTASSTLNLSNVSLTDDGILVQCSAFVNGTSSSAKAILRVQSKLRATSTIMISDIQNDSLTVTMGTSPSFPSNETESKKNTDIGIIGGIATLSVLFFCALMTVCIILLRLPSKRIDLSNARAKLSWHRSGIYAATLIPTESSATSSLRDGIGLKGVSSKTPDIPATQLGAGIYMTRLHSPLTSPSLRDVIGRKGCSTLQSSDLTTTRSISEIYTTSLPSPVTPLRNSFSSGGYKYASAMYSNIHLNKPTPPSPLTSTPLRNEDGKCGGLSSLSRSEKITASPPPPLVSLKNILTSGDYKSPSAIYSNIPATKSGAGVYLPTPPSPLTSTSLMEKGGIRGGSPSQSRSGLSLGSLRNCQSSGEHKSVYSNMSNSTATNKTGAEIYKPSIPSPLTSTQLRDNRALTSQSPVIPGNPTTTLGSGIYMTSFQSPSKMTSQRKDFGSGSHQSPVYSDIPAARPVSKICSRTVPSSPAAPNSSKNDSGLGGHRFQMIPDISASRRSRPTSVPIPLADVDRSSEPLSPITEQDEAVTYSHIQQTQTPYTWDNRSGVDN